jgi:uncharacterized protein
MTRIDFEKIKENVLMRLAAQLPRGLYYHGIHHTYHDVLPAAERFAEEEGISDADFLLVQTAALYHDVGYIESNLEHEAIGARIVEAELPRWGYDPDQIHKISNMILATKIPQAARTLLEQIICDADMDSLGREDFFITSHSLRLELRLHSGLVISVKDWYIRQLKFLQSHVYFTDAARRLREPGKQQNIAQLKDLLNSF